MTRGGSITRMSAAGLAALAVIVAGGVAAADDEADAADEADAVAEAEADTVAEADTIEMPAEVMRVADVEAEADVSATRGAMLPAVSVGPVRAQLFGSFRPTVGIANRPDAAPRDRWGYGIAGSRIDAGLDTQVTHGVSAQIYVTLATERDPADDSMEAKVDIERALVKWQPVRSLSLAVGRALVPLSAQSATPSYARVFPNRISIDDTFVLPVDVGAQAAYTSDKLTALVGVWNGVASDVMLDPGATERGLLYSARVEVTPLGKLAFDEGVRPESPRVGIGAAVTYRAATAYTPIGAVGSRSRDLRASASARLAWRGLFVQAELLRRQITDDLSMRPDVATAGYLQATYRFAVRSYDVAPLARAGIERVRQLSAPDGGSVVEIGAAVFPLARTSDRLQLAALLSRENDPELGVTQQMIAQLRLGF